jgi:NitT/TauT family transport system permease protein
MSATTSQSGPSKLAIGLFGTAKRLALSALPFVVVIVLWQLASLFFPRFLFPSLVDVFWRCIEIFSTGSMFADVLATVLRILAGLTGAFIVGGVLALLMVRSRAVDQFLSPILSLFQGIPARHRGEIRIITLSAGKSLRCLSRNPNRPPQWSKWP